MTTDQIRPPAPPSRTDVVIVGAGPTGLTLACALAARGIDHVLIDATGQGGNTSRAAVIHARTLEVLDDLGVTGELCRRGVVVPRFTIRDRDRTLLHVPFDGLPTRFPYTLMLPQNITEQILGERLTADGGTVHRRHRLTGIENDDDGVVATVAGPGGTTHRVHARYVAGCDGMHSAVRDRTGIGFTGDRYGQSFVLADVRMAWSLPRDTVSLFFSPAGLVVVAPLPGDRYRVVATLDDAPEQPGLADLQNLLDARGPRRAPATVTEVLWSSRFRVHHRLADRYRRGSVFLAGDAAHVHSPAGGQGMNTGIQDAMVLARLLADAVTAPPGTVDLDAYQARRRPVAAGVVAMTDRLTRAATVRNPVARRLRNAALSLAGRSATVRHRLALNLSELSVDAGATRPAPRSAADLST
ncbi:FAD-dependent oxidoreductase [Jidongwangia harbinensis]|uniref:FAD-dependent oxidoreductase n=1 Tax=Jidongwangia harbinensis TaxID=2878561 RepID=UPI001CD927CA|nr:FAD-dependent oxidoreductase [Jidongwangia harbinensis]MCA2211802.1 FAD-dependent oxidoreductase [Jidongwangia harbinensis]